MSEWISVKKQMPEPTQWRAAISVLAHKDFETGEVEVVVRPVRWWPLQELPADVTHWFPLPDPAPLAAGLLIADMKWGDVRYAE